MYRSFAFEEENTEYFHTMQAKCIKLTHLVNLFINQFTEQQQF